jgi:hypothetical protein
LYGELLKIGNVLGQIAHLDEDVLMTRGQIAAGFEQNLLLQGAEQRRSGNAVTIHGGQIGLHPKSFFAAPVDFNAVDAGQGAQLRGDVGQDGALGPGGRHTGGKLQGVVGHFVNGHAHDFSLGMHGGRQFGAGEVDGAIDRHQILLRIGAFAETSVSYNLAIAHGGAHADEVGQRQDLAFERPGDRGFHLRRGGAGVVGDDADHWKIEPRQDFNGNLPIRVGAISDECAIDERPE